MHHLALYSLTCLLASAGTVTTAEFKAGAESLRYRVEVSKDELRGPQPQQAPHEVKRAVHKRLEQLRHDGKGLKPETERNLESFFIVADAFEADGRLSTARDVLLNLEENLYALSAARRGKPLANSLITGEDDLLAFRDAHNVHRITAHYCAGGQPSEKGYRWLKSKGVTAVINLRQSTAHEKELLERLGIRYVHVSWPDLQPPSLEQVRQIVGEVQAEERRGGMVFQHCLRGIGRDGTMVCCVRVADGVSAEKAIADWLEATPTWLEDQARDRQGRPVQVERVKEFERAMQGKKKDAKQ